MLKKIIGTTILWGSLVGASNAELINASDYFNGLITAGTTTQSASNIWQLGYLNSGGVFTLFDYSDSGIVVGGGDQTKFDSYNLGGPLSFSGSHYGFGINVDGTNASYFGDNIAANELYAHPGDSSLGDVILRYLASTTDTYEFDTKIRNAHTGEILASVIKNNASTPISSATIINSELVFTQLLSLTAGDTVDFVIDSSGSFLADGTAINANAGIPDNGSVPVPEPSTFAIMAVALLGMMRFRSRT
jgi:hypothetical protein